LNFLKGVTPEEAMEQARAQGVTRFITIGTEPADHGVVLGLAQKYFPEVACTLGVHPHEGKVYTDEVEAYLDANVDRKEVVAVGEIGLDYYYDNSPREEQKDAFRRQLALAKKHRLPVEIHTRDAEADTIEILKEFKGDVSGIIHCFTGTQWLAEQSLDLGMDISFSGVVTFKSADELRAVARYVPLDRLHVETDAPFLTPMPHRGKSNVPAFVVHTAQAIADLKSVSTEKLLEVTRANARRTFPKLVLD
ncbi:MAG TPA: TatD family hydrolase, partial [Bdellovibrionales bacterium]|nr:TatD family hydrolase [Bdellovibrionales bacterium]